MFEKIDLQTVKRSSGKFFKAKFLFLTSENPRISYFNVWEQICKFLKNRLVDPQVYIRRFFIAIVVFLVSKSPFIPNFKVKKQILKNRKNRRVDHQVFRVKQVGKPSENDSGVFIILRKNLGFF